MYLKLQICRSEVRQSSFGRNNLQLSPASQFFPKMKYDACLSTSKIPFLLLMHWKSWVVLHFLLFLCLLCGYWGEMENKMEYCLSCPVTLVSTDFLQNFHKMKDFNQSHDLCTGLEDRTWESFTCTGSNCSLY